MIIENASPNELSGVDPEDEDTVIVRFIKDQTESGMILGKVY